MNYAAQANRPNPAAALGALGIPGAIGALLVFGLAVKVVAPPPDEILDTWDVPIVPEPEVVPEPQDRSDAAETPQTVPVPEYTPTPPDSDFTFELGSTAPIGELPGFGSDASTAIGPVDFGIPDPAPTFAPISASPKGNTDRWITTSDYRTSWINRGYEGVAGFALQIDASGRVSNCAITRSTGYSALDDATCRLLERRARFSPAKDSSGAQVAGTYSSTVNWQIPE